MSEQFSKFSENPEELGMIQPGEIDVPKPMELTEEEDRDLLNLLTQAQQAEKTGDLQAASDLYSQYRTEYQRLRHEKVINIVNVNIEKAEQILGKENVFGPTAVEKTFGIRLETAEIPKIPFSNEELERAEKLHQFLILRVNKAPDSSPLTMQKMNELLQGDFKKEGKGKILINTSSYQNEDFYTKTVPKLAWALATKDVIPDSMSKNYLAQTDQIVSYLKEEVFEGKDIPPIYAAAIKKYLENKPEIERLASPLTSGFSHKQAAEILASLDINQLTRQSPVEAMYDVLMVMQNSPDPDKRTRLLKYRDTWTNGLTLDGGLVRFGNFGAWGASVCASPPGFSSHSSIGVSFSRNQ